MAQILSKISLVPAGAASPHEESSQRPRETGHLHEVPSSFKKFAIEKSLDTSVAPLVSPAQHQAVRRQLFSHLVHQVLNEKTHPFSRLDTEVKQDMINSITEELVRSHYKI